MVQVLVAASSDLRVALPATAGNMVFSIAATEAAVRHQCADTQMPDVLLLDFEFPGFSGLKGMLAARDLVGDRPIGVLVPGVPLELAHRLIAAGADAIVPVATQAAALRDAVSLLLAGERFVIFSEQYLPGQRDDAVQLSDRELQVLQGICEGQQNKEIAHAFQVQEVTVKMHVRAIIRKLNARNRTQAAMIARDLGLV